MPGLNSQGQDKGRNDGDALSGATTILGIIFAFFFTGPFTQMTGGDVASFAAENYGDWTTGIALVFWFIVSALGIVFVSRIVLTLLYRMLVFYFGLLMAKLGVR